MDLTFSQDELEFRDELREWLAANSPGEEPRGDEDAIFAFRTSWQRSLYEAGWAAVHWPQEYGGRDATLMESAIFFEEVGRVGAPLPANVLGLLLAGPTIIKGTDLLSTQPLLSETMTMYGPGARPVAQLRHCAAAHCASGAAHADDGARFHVDHRVERLAACPCLRGISDHAR